MGGWAWTDEALHILESSRNGRSDSSLKFGPGDGNCPLQLLLASPPLLGVIPPCCVTSLSCCVAIKRSAVSNTVFTDKADSLSFQGDKKICGFYALSL